MLAKNVNDNAGIQSERSALRFFASKLAPTVVGACQASALSNALIANKSLASPFSPQHKAIICLSAVTL